jgi:hypothetical protein
MFDLDHTISEWRRQMQAGGIKTVSALDELESHLRDDVERQMQSGSSAQKAIEAAIKRIGEIDLIRNEFAKAGLMKEMHEQKLKGVFLVALGILYSLFVIICVFFKLGSFASSTPAEQASSLAAVVVTVLFGVSTFFIQRFLPVISDKRARAKVYVFGGTVLSLWLVIFYHIVLMHFDFTLSQLVVACLWAMSPVGAFAALVVGLDKAAFYKSRNLIRD